MAQTNWFVGQPFFPPGTGTLNDPCFAIQSAIDQPTTVSGDSITVLPGTYVENVDFGTKDLVLASGFGVAFSNALFFTVLP